MFDEKDDIPRILKGDYRAFEALVKHYQHLVYHIVDKLVHNKADKEDISQEVFIKVYHNLRSFSYRSKLSTWIASIAYRTTINYIRDHKKEAGVKELEDIDVGASSVAGPDTLSERKDLTEYIYKLIEQMPVQYRSILVLYHLKEFSYDEIGHITGMPAGTVKNYLFRARKLLKEKLKSYQYGEYLD